MYTGKSQLYFQSKKFGIPVSFLRKYQDTVRGDPVNCKARDDRFSARSFMDQFACRRFIRCYVSSFKYLGNAITQDLGDDADI